MSSEPLLAWWQEPKPIPALLSTPGKALPFCRMLVLKSPGCLEQCLNSLISDCFPLCRDEGLELEGASGSHQAHLSALDEGPLSSTQPYFFSLKKYEIPYFLGYPIRWQVSYRSSVGL